VNIVAFFVLDLDAPILKLVHLISSQHFFLFSHPSVSLAVAQAVFSHFFLGCLTLRA
jgi:hypothetical protein